MLRLGNCLRAAVCVLGSLVYAAPAAHGQSLALFRPIDPTGVVLKPDDPDVPPHFVLSSQSTGSSGGFSLTIRSFYNPDQAIATTVAPQASGDAALTRLAQLSDEFPTSNMVLGQHGAGFQNDGSAGVGDASTFLESNSRLIVLWVKDTYLMEVDDSTGEGMGLAVVRARDVESKLEALL